ARREAGPQVIVAEISAGHWILIGFAVVFVVGWIGETLREAVDDAKKDQAARTGSGILPAAATSGPTSQLCAGNAHHRCPGYMGSAAAGNACHCTCHTPIHSQFCAE